MNYPEYTNPQRCKAEWLPGEGAGKLRSCCRMGTKFPVGMSEVLDFHSDNIRNSVNVLDANELSSLMW